MEKWTAPAIASLRGDNTIPLQRTFGSLTEYLSSLSSSYVPAGGTAGQILAKIDATDYNTQWIENYAEKTKTLVKSDNSSTLPKGAAVYTSGANGTNILVKGAIATSDATSATVLGLLDQSLATNAQGYVVTEGLVTGIDTSAAVAGDPVWLSPTVIGGLTFGLANKPNAPYHLVYLGVVTRAHAVNGEINVHMLNGWELEELHNVSALSPTTGDTIVYNASTSLWEKGKYPAEYLTGTIQSARLSGSYTGITGIGTVTGLTSSSRIWAQTDVRIGNASSTVVSSDPYALIVTPQAYTGLPVRIGEHYAIASVGTQNSQFTIFAGPASGGEVIIKRAANTTVASFNSNGLYMSEGWLRTYGARGWYNETYGGGIYMDDVNTVKVYNGKAFYVPSAITSGSNITASGSVTAGGAIILSGAGIAYYGSWVGGGSPNQIGFRWASPYVTCTVDNVISAICANFSDRRLKTDIVSFDDGMDFVRQLRPVKYNPLDVVGFDDETFEPIIGDLGPHDEMLGFIADEVQEIYQNAVRGSGTEIKSIDNVQVLSMAISAIKQLDSRLQVLESQ